MHIPVKREIGWNIVSLGGQGDPEGHHEGLQAPVPRLGVGLDKLIQTFGHSLPPFICTPTMTATDTIPTIWSGNDR